MNRKTEVRVFRVLGKGSFGIVYEAETVPDGEPVAAKIALIDKRSGLASVVSEKLVGMLVKGRPHPRIVSFLGEGKRQNADTGIHFFEVILLMELVPGGSLLHALQNSRGPFAEERARKFVCQVLEGLFHLHNVLNVIHRSAQTHPVLLGSLLWQREIRCSSGSRE